jgi:SAM-dependent methyltransferase
VITNDRVPNFGASVARVLGFGFFDSKLLKLLSRSIRSSPWVRRQLQAAQERYLLDPALSPNDRELLGRVAVSLDPADTMFIPGQADHYLKVGLSAMRCIDTSLENSNAVLDPAPSILDFPCGHGRVLRFLRARYPSSAITVSEIDVNALEFCEETFKCRGVVSSPDFDTLALPGPFDLVWCGSLLTHLPEDETKGLLRLIFRHLSPNGTCIITTHGKLSVDRISSGANFYGLTKAAEREMLSQFEKTGYGYADYKVGSRYGISLVSRERMQQLVAETGAWHETSFIEHGWDEHQDVYALRRKVTS